MSCLRLNLLIQPLLLDLPLVHDLPHLLNLEKTFLQFVLRFIKGIIAYLECSSLLLLLLCEFLELLWRSLVLLNHDQKCIELVFSVRFFSAAILVFIRITDSFF